MCVVNSEFGIKLHVDSTVVCTLLNQQLPLHDVSLFVMSFVRLDAFTWSNKDTREVACVHEITDLNKQRCDQKFSLCL